MIVSIETIEHLENPFHILKEFSRTLKPEGLLIVATPNTQCIRSRLKYFVIGLPVQFEYSRGDLRDDEFHLTPVAIGQFLYSFRVNDMKLIDIVTVPWEKTSKMARFFLKFLMIVIRPLSYWARTKRSHLVDNYMNILSKEQLAHVEYGEQLIIVAQKMASP